MVIVMVVDAWDQPFNGTVVSSRRFAEAMVAMGITVRVLALEGQAHPVAGVELYEFPKLSIPGVNRVMETMRVQLAKPARLRIREALQGASLLHIQFPLFLGGMAITEARRMQLPVVASFHVQAENILRNLKLPTPVLSTGVYALMRHFIFRHADVVLAPSAFARTLVRDAGIDGRVEVLSNGVPADQLAAFQERQELPEQVSVLCVGRHAPEKRYDLIIKALASVTDKQRFTVTFAGMGPARGALEKLSARLGVAASFVSPSDEELKALYARADLFLHAGESELEGMSVMQAMAAGVPVIVSDSQASAAGELTAIAESRFSFPDAGALARRIDELTQNPDLVNRISRENHEAMRRLDHRQSVNALLDVYAGLHAGIVLPDGLNEAA